MKKFEMEKKKISYEISGESHVCFSEIGISTENQVSNITDKEGKLRIVFHAHKDKSNIHPRAMYIGTVNFENVNGTDRMRISKEYITPKLLQ